MATLRGSTAGAFTSNARTLTLPGGSVAGDWAVVFGYDGFVSPTLSNITGWTSNTMVTGFGDAIVGYKILTAGDITAGSVTITWNNSYGGYAALSTVAATYITVQRSASASNGDTGTGRSHNVLLSNGDIGLYWCFERNDGSTPSPSIDRGTSVDASGVTNVGGAYRTESYSSSTAVLPVSSTNSTSGGNVDGFVAVYLSDNPLPGETLSDANLKFDGTPLQAAWLYKGRATAVNDSGSGA